ncbi:GTP cyclohydrolase II RibA [Nocardia sp. NPDC005978]|uniref:GTP cyclohydrolase II n=1 Tax=Nocardia sp. NPDC005978 TaxID=3156725 RepID=UPI0033A4FEB8
MTPIAALDDARDRTAGRTTPAPRTDTAIPADPARAGGTSPSREPDAPASPPSAPGAEPPPGSPGATTAQPTPRTPCPGEPEHPARVGNPVTRRWARLRGAPARTGTRAADHPAAVLPPVPGLAATRHRMTRYGRTISTRVLPVGDGDLDGHALLFGALTDGCLVRVHSRCLYGDALRSDDCDCGPELDLAMDMIQAEGAGVLIYLEQEGRGAGLVAKARGYGVSQQDGLDTFASYARLGLAPDARSYDHAAETLNRLGLRSIRLLTNNPDKVRALRASGLAVEHLPLRIRPANRATARYLAAKRAARGHRLPRFWLWERIAQGALMLCYVGLVGGVCAVLIWKVVPATVFTEVLGPGHTLPVLLGLIAGRCGWSRTRLLRARIQLSRGRWARGRMHPDR